MARAFVALGSNIRPEENIRSALRLLSTHCLIMGISTVYLTEPLERPAQPLFYNCVVEIETEVPPLEFKQDILRRIETFLARVRTKDKFAPRTIDLDLILYDGLEMTTGDLTLPDPDIFLRPFLAHPLAELARGLPLPGSALRIEDVAASLNRGSMIPLESYSNLLKQEFKNGRRQTED